MIGFFDSGLGGLSILKEVEKVMPEYDYIYLGDNARTPYGSRSDEVIYEFTVAGVKELINRGAELVILACNTSSGVALRRIQQEFLPKYFPDKKVLGIIIPTAEEANNFSGSGHIGILATEATVNSKTYEKEIEKINPDLKIIGQPCPLFVPIIEAGEVGWEGLDLAIKKYTEALLRKDKDIDAVILGCTHYALIQDRIRKQIPGDIKIISQGEIVAKKLKDYIARHPEIEEKLGKAGKKVFLTTEKSERIERLTKMFFNINVSLKLINFN